MAEQEHGRRVGACVAIAIWLLLFDHSLITKLVAGFMLWFGVAMVWVGARRLWTRRPLLIIRDRGLDYPQLGLISWDEITALVIANVGGASVLQIHVVDEIAHRRQARLLLRPFLWADRAAAAIGLTDGSRRLSVPETLIPMSCEALRTRIELRAGREWPH